LGCEEEVVAALDVAGLEVVVGAGEWVGCGKEAVLRLLVA
jgi:hypothetical protein